MKNFTRAVETADRKLCRLGACGATGVLTAAAVAALLGLHVLVCLAEHERVAPLALINLGVEILVVALPIILYCRGVIGALNAARARQDELSRHLALAVREAEEASRAKSTFLANMSHELRTPLNAILGFSEIMKEQHLGPVDNPRYLSYSHDIHDSGRHLLGIINDVLDLAKIEAGKMSLDNAQEFDLTACLRGAVGMVGGLAEKYGVTLACDLGADGLRILAVERMIRQVVLNLVGNAIKFTPAGGSVILRGALAPNGSYVVGVRDSGIGMSASELATALVPFGQNATRLEGKQEGTGLGLPLAKAMLELHGGGLEIESWPGQGTIVTLTFPRERLVPQLRIVAA